MNATEQGLEGVVVRPLVLHEDGRGRVVEIIRHEWLDGHVPVQWAAVRSRPGVLRGVHWHERQELQLTVVVGSLVLGLADLRQGSPSEGRAAVLTLRSAAPILVEIPPGVAHGVWCPEPTVHLQAAVPYAEPQHRRGVRWDDHALGIPWPADLSEPLLSDEDAALPRLADVAVLPGYAALHV